jgi:ACS family glucarate transporter-like MFS transporter
MDPMSLARAEDRPTRVRWIVIALLTGLSFTSYVQRMNISVAKKFMMPELGLTDIQMGQLFASFLIGYTLFQIPTGVWADRRGPRLVLVLAAATWGIATVLTGFLPGAVVTGVAGFGGLWAVRFLLGGGEAATYPAAARAVANWTTASERALGNAVMIGGLSLGSAVTPPLISWLMVYSGWRASFYLVSGLAFAMAALWWWYGADGSEQHHRVNPAERALITAGRAAGVPMRIPAGTWWPVFQNRDVALVSTAYFFSGYIFYIFVFWLYTYLTDVRGFSVLKGGAWASLPFVVAAILTPLGGGLSDHLVGRVGPTWARRGVAAAGLSLSGLCMIVGVLARSPYLAIAGLALSIGFNQFAEPNFWAASIDIGGPLAGTACGILNMMGNLGGVVSTALVPVLVHYAGWPIALGSGAAFACVAAALWLLVRCDQPIRLP